MSQGMYALYVRVLHRLSISIWMQFQSVAQLGLKEQQLLNVQALEL